MAFLQSLFPQTWLPLGCPLILMASLQLRAGEGHDLRHMPPSLGKDMLEGITRLNKHRLVDF